jgi:hypothetical protein
VRDLFKAERDDDTGPEVGGRVPAAYTMKAKSTGLRTSAIRKGMRIPKVSIIGSTSFGRCHGD